MRSKQWFWIVTETEVRDHFVPTIRDIQRAVCRRFPGVKLHDLLSCRRTRDVIIPRQLAMFLSRELTPKSLPSIGRSFGDRDHTTVLHGVNKISRLSASDTVMSKVIQEVREELGCA